jgi:hypothetical protein
MNCLLLITENFMLSSWGKRLAATNAATKGQRSVPAVTSFYSKQHSVGTVNSESLFKRCQRQCLKVDILRSIRPYRLKIPRKIPPMRTMSSNGRYSAVYLEIVPVVILLSLFN